MSRIPIPHGVRLWLVRHGSTAWSEVGRLCGWSDPPLSELGRREVRGLRGEAARLLAGRPAGVWSSDLLRARETARIAGLPAVPDARLRELDFGQMEGARWEELSAGLRSGLAGFDGFRAPGGESVAELGDRVHGFVRSLVPGMHLVVTHGGVIRLLLGERTADRHLAPGRAVRLEGQTAARS